MSPFFCVRRGCRVDARDDELMMLMNYLLNAKSTFRFKCTVTLAIQLSGINAN